MSNLASPTKIPAYTSAMELRLTLAYEIILVYDEPFAWALFKLFILD